MLVNTRLDNLTKPNPTKTLPLWKPQEYSTNREKKPHTSGKIPTIISKPSYPLKRVTPANPQNQPREWNSQTTQTQQHRGHNSHLHGRIGKRLPEDCWMELIALEAAQTPTRHFATRNWCKEIYKIAIIPAS